MSNSLSGENKIFLCWVALLAAVSLTYTCPSQAESFTWRALGEDLEIVEATIPSPLIFSPRLICVRTALQRYRLIVASASQLGRKKASVRQMAKHAQAIVAINANFFDEFGAPLGLVLQRGNLQQGIHKGGETLTGVLLVTREGVEILHRSNFSPQRALEAVQAGPRLLVSGKPSSSLKDSSARARRSIACIDGEKKLLLCATSGVTGLTWEEAQNFLLHPQIACQHALNLDGGGSTQFYVSMEVLGQSGMGDPLLVKGRDNVPVILALIRATP